MAHQRKIRWSDGAVFAIPLPDGTYAIGQVVALMMPNVAYCLLTSLRSPMIPREVPYLNSNDVISALAITRGQLDSGSWRVLGDAPTVLGRNAFANERFVADEYVGAKVYDAAIAEAFLAAFHGLAAWDDWKDPFYLDALLVTPSKKPTNLVYRTPPATT